MKAKFELELLGLLLSSKEHPTREGNPVLWRMFSNAGMDLDSEVTDQDRLERAYQVLSAMSNDIAYFDANEMKVNKALNSYLVTLHLNMANGIREDFRTIAIMACAAGNRSKDKDHDSGVELWIDEANSLIMDLKGRFDGLDQLDNLHYLINRFAYCERVLEIVDTFIVSHNGMLAGVEEFAPGDYSSLALDEEPDFVAGVECSETAGCECGCSLEHPTMVLEGLEDLLNNKRTPAAHYAAGVFFANSLELRLLQGNEEGVMDSIKEMGTKAYEWCRDALKSFIDLFSSEAAEEEVKDNAEVGENNKKAIQSMTDKGVRINDAAKAGILQLAKTTDSTGAMARIVSSLNTAGDGSRVIDGLTGFLSKQLGKSGKLGEKIAKAQKALDDLKASNSKASSTSGDNKDVAANTKTDVSDKIAKAKEALKEVKAQAGAQKKIVNGVKKAIRGITPKIFTKGGNDAGAGEEKAPKAKTPPKKGTE